MKDNPEILARYFQIGQADVPGKAVRDPRKAVAADVALLRPVTVLPAQWILSGLVYDVVTGRVEVVVPPGTVRAACNEGSPMPSDSNPLQIGCLVYEGLDPIDLVGPLEVLSRLSNGTCRLFGVQPGPVRAMKGLRLIPDGALSDAGQLDVVLVPGGFGQEDLMEDVTVLEWIRRQAAGAACVFSVCTGALLCGAAGLLRGRRATTHWSALHLLPCFGAIPVNQRVVRDERMLFAAGVTAGIDGALRLSADLRGQEEAQTIQLHMAYAPEPPFHSGTPETAPPKVLESARRDVDAITMQRTQTARRVAVRLGISHPVDHP